MASSRLASSLWMYSISHNLLITHSISFMPDSSATSLTWILLHSQNIMQVQLDVPVLESRPNSKTNLCSPDTTFWVNKTPLAWCATLAAMLVANHVCCAVPMSVGCDRTLFWILSLCILKKEQDQNKIQFSKIILCMWQSQIEIILLCISHASSLVCYSAKVPLRRGGRLKALCSQSVTAAHSL